MVLNKKKSQEFKKIKGSFKKKFGLFVNLVLIMAILSGCANEVNNLSSNTEISTEIAIEEKNVPTMKVYQPGEHKVFYMTTSGYLDKLNKVCAYPNIEIPEGYQLVDTEMGIKPNNILAIVLEYENTVPVLAPIVGGNTKAIKTSFGTPVSLEDNKTK